MVEQVEDLIDEEGVACEGLWDPESKVIYLEKGKSKRQKFSALIHEFSHAVLDFTGVNESIIPGNLEEIIVCQMERHFLRFLEVLYASQPEST